MSCFGWKSPTVNPGSAAAAVVTVRNSVPTNSLSSSVDDVELKNYDILKKELNQQIQQGKNRRNDMLINKAFEDYQASIKDISDPEEQISLLRKSLKSFGISYKGGKELEKGAVSYGITTKEQYKYIVERPSVNELWVKGLPVIQVIADALPKCDFDEDEEAQLTRTSQLSQAEINTVVAVVSDALKDLLVENCKRLEKSLSNKKLINNTSVKYWIAECGTIENFHGFHQEIKAIVGEEYLL
jgi:hypothetical protein